MEFTEYQERVFDYLEYMGYPIYIEHFDPKEVAKSVYAATVVFYKNRQSHRMAAVAIFGLTWEKIQTGDNIHGMKGIVN